MTANELHRLTEIEGRLDRLEKLLDKQKRIQECEATVESWRFLVRRRHPWRKQLYLKGRNMTARQLVGSMKANHMDDERAAANYRLPIEAVHEALAYVQKNLDLLQTEAEIERLMNKQEGGARVPEPVS